jgi:hypothetical protein
MEDIYSENQVLKLKHERALQDLSITHEREKKHLDRAIKDLQKELKSLKSNQPGSPLKLQQSPGMVTSMEKATKPRLRQGSPQQELPRPQSSANILYTARTSMSGLHLGPSPAIIDAQKYL